MRRQIPLTPRPALHASIILFCALNLAGCSSGIFHPGPPPPDSVTFPPASTQGWLQQFGTGYVSSNPYRSGDTARGVATDFQGNVIVLDQTYGAFTGFTTNNQSQFAIIKFASDGTQLWIQQLGTGSGDLPYSLTTDTQGNILVGGNTRGAFTGFTNSAAAKQSVVIKLNPSGQVLWTQQFPAPGASGTSSQTTSLATDSQSNVVVGGDYRDARNNLYGYVMKLAASTGTALWSQTSSTLLDVNGVASDPQDNILAVGDFSAGSSSSSAVNMVAKLDGTSGQITWQQLPVTYASFGAQNLIATQLALDQQGNVFVGGLDQSSGYSQCTVLKLANISGATQWQQQFGAVQSCIPGNLATDTAGNVLMGGGAPSPFFPGSSPPATDDIFLAKLDPTGAAIWLQQFGTGNDGAQGYTPINALIFVATDSQNHAYVAGTTFGAFPNFSNAGKAADIFVTQFGQ